MQCCLIYPGQGSQSIGMGDDLISNFKVAERLLEEANDALHIDFRSILRDEEKLNQTIYTQPAILLVSAMAHYVLQEEAGIVPQLVFGHSLGEVSAYCLNGGCKFDKAVMLTHERGKLMAKACEGKEVGMMVVIGLDERRLIEMSESARASGLRVWCANFNQDRQTVLAGIKKDLDDFSVDLKRTGAKKCIMLKMSVVSHCELIEEAAEPFSSLLSLNINDCNVDVLSNANLEVYRKKDDAVSNLSKQLIKPVLYRQSVIKATELGVECFVELGSGTVLSGLNSKISNVPTVSVSSSEGIKKVLGIFD